ncbi:hypothetical protein CWRG_02330 [Chthonomonas calidirosea]|uniref:Uncharacterized protein n=1 Tax=Chthonomonas calidirosea (strain DSM 23976 / ICMP 18418 / T49) TaxID=1303518 RepID=S0EV20_CHTCT|nr:hypothetical protein CCALI_01743 [Chthonomonas calidirosea T49]CEK18919.1 hypothetical protein CWRG_02330 [Chthonomonas calidirosea]CEK18931.1 hypothetical protein CP488_02349 [Chthonomonas calidirosea]CEK19921.1 hypothetical protein CTKA_02352 [Chthonomonas calidirosea]
MNRQEGIANYSPFAIRQKNEIVPSKGIIKPFERDFLCSEKRNQ